MFEISTPLGFTVRTSETYWQKIIIKHPDIAELIELVQETLHNPFQGGLGGISEC